MRQLLAILALAAGTLLASAAPVEAHQQPYDSGIQTEHNLCVFFRPYGVGTIVYHFRNTGYERSCGVCIGNALYEFDVQYFYVWSGPWDTVLISSNSVAC
jgi:hypothetical protein